MGQICTQYSTGWKYHTNFTQYTMMIKTSIKIWRFLLSFKLWQLKTLKFISFFNFSFFLAKFCQEKKKDCNLSLHKISLKSRDQYFIICIIKKIYKKNVKHGFYLTFDNSIFGLLLVEQFYHNKANGTSHACDLFYWRVSSNSSWINVTYKIHKTIRFMI
jgi:hypothetical protein